MAKKQFFPKRGLAGYRVSSPGKKVQEFATLKDAKNYAKKQKAARIFKINYLLDFFK